MRRRELPPVSELGLERGNRRIAAQSCQLMSDEFR